MNPSNPLDSLVFISLPEEFIATNANFQLDPTVLLPVQRENSDSNTESFSIEDLTWEQILAGILTVLAYDNKTQHKAYYRSLLLAAKPNIKQELTDAAILKAKNEDFDIAEEIFLALQGIDPEDMANMLNMALFFDQRADSYRRSSLFEDADAYDESAFRYYKQVMEAEEVIPDAFFNAGFFFLKQKNFSRAKDCFETYVTLSAALSEEQRGKNGDYKIERAQEIINDIQNRNLDDELFKSAYDFISMGEEEKGLEAIRSFIEKNPTVWNAWFMLGWALRRLERWDDARSALEQAIQCEGANTDTYNELAICLTELGDYQGAKSYLTKAMQLESENTKIMSNLGYLALKEGNIEEARLFFLAVLEFDPNDKIAQEMLKSLEELE